MQYKKFKGDVGIGTLIVFIAMVLVAAIAATVLLNVSGMLQQRSSAVGKETTKQVSSNLIVMSVVGTQNSISDARIGNLTVTIKAAAGSGKIDIGNMLIRIDNGSAEVKLLAAPKASHNQATATQFGLVERVDPNGVFDGSGGIYVIDSNALIDINITLPNVYVTPRSNLNIELIPEVDTPIQMTFKTPETFNSLIIPLGP